MFENLMIMDDKITDMLKKTLRQDSINLTSRGNTAIFSALYCARKMNLKKKTVLIPDQGGWLTYKKYPEYLEMKAVELKTDDGIIILDELKKALKNHDVNCLLYENPAGYFADQPIKDIYEACKGKCKVIMDVSGCIGDNDLCNGEHADIMVGSFGKWKIVDAGYGGFVSAKDAKTFNHAKEIFNLTEFDDLHSENILGKLIEAQERIKGLYKTCKVIKEDLKGLNVLQKDKKGVVVVIAYGTENDKQRIIDYCEKHKYEYTQCPRYIRVNRDAISIEVKRRS